MRVLSRVSPSYRNQRRICESPALQEDSRPALPVVLMTIICEGYTSPIVRVNRRPGGPTSCCENAEDSVKRDNPSRCDHCVAIGIVVDERANENQGGSRV